MRLFSGVRYALIEDFTSILLFRTKKVPDTVNKL